MKKEEAYYDFVQTLNNEQRSALLKALQSEEEQGVEQKHNVTEDFRVIKDNNSSLDRGKKSVQAGNNTWVDNGEDRHIKTPEIQLTPRNRKPPKKKQVTCHMCGKTHNVNSNLIYGEFYRCDRCVGN